MKRALILFLIAAFLISVAGCVAKTKHAELLEEKIALEKKLEEISAKEAGLRDEIAAKRNEIKGLRSELKEARAGIRGLDKELAETKTKSSD